MRAFAAPAFLSIVAILAILPILVIFAGCAPPTPRGLAVEEVFARFEAAFGEGDAEALDGLYPEGWALVTLAGEPRRSLEGRELRRRLAGLFRGRAPADWRDLPGSIRFSPDGDYLLFLAEWTSLAPGTDRLVVEQVRVGLEREAEPGSAGWSIRELTIWTR